MIAVRRAGFDISPRRRPATTAGLCEAYHCKPFRAFPYCSVTRLRKSVSHEACSHRTRLSARRASAADLARARIAFAARRNARCPVHDRRRPRTVERRLPRARRHAPSRRGKSRRRPAKAPARSSSESQPSRSNFPSRCSRCRAARARKLGSATAMRRSSRPIGDATALAGELHRRPERLRSRGRVPARVRRRCHPRDPQPRSRPPSGGHVPARRRHARLRRQGRVGSRQRARAPARHARRAINASTRCRATSKCC